MEPNHFDDWDMYRFSTNLHEKLLSFKRYFYNFGPGNHIDTDIILEDSESIGSDSDLKLFIWRILEHRTYIVR